MNKYQSALTNLHNRAMRGGDRDGKIIKQTKTLQELVNKATPKKVIFENNGEELLCPNCYIDLMGSINDPDHDPYYCFECGQALDWSNIIDE